jgi:hypothetical protein
MSRSPFAESTRKPTSEDQVERFLFGELRMSSSPFAERVRKPTSEDPTGNFLWMALIKLTS